MISSKVIQRPINQKKSMLFGETARTAHYQDKHRLKSKPQKTHSQT